MHRHLVTAIQQEWSDPKSAFAGSPENIPHNAHVYLVGFDCLSSGSQIADLSLHNPKSRNGYREKCTEATCSGVAKCSALPAVLPPGDGWKGKPDRRQAVGK